MEQEGLVQITGALDALHSPTSSSCTRREAQNFLEAVKQKDDIAPYWGWQLAQRIQPDNFNSQINDTGLTNTHEGSSNGSLTASGTNGAAGSKTNPVVRHFGLSLLQHAIQYHFIQYNAERQLAIRNWVVDLAVNVAQDDPHYLKEKLSFLWVAVAKRMWGGDGETHDSWKDMDATLLKMWHSSTQTRLLTLSVFRTLFEDLYVLEDPVAAKRGALLSAQCIEVVTCESDLEQTYESRIPTLVQLRADSDGWLDRWAKLLEQCLNMGINDAETESHATAVLECLKTCLYWIFPRSIRRCNILSLLSMALSQTQSVEVQMLAADCLHCVFSRSISNDDDFQAIVGSVFEAQGVLTLTQVYQSIKVVDQNGGIDSLEDREYVFLKKFVEMIVKLGEYITSPVQRLDSRADIPDFLTLLLQTTAHPSLVVSGLSLQFWCAVLRGDSKSDSSPGVASIFPRLLEVSCSRCLRYEDINEDHISRQFLELDFDSQPEILTFLGNYRRYMEDIVRLTVCRVPEESMQYLRQCNRDYFQSQAGWECLNSVKLDHKGNPTYFLAYSQLMLVESALRGVSRWKLCYQEPDKEQIMERLLTVIEQWGQDLLALNIRDPLLLRKLVQSLVQFAPLLKDNKLMFQVLEKLLTACTTDYPKEMTKSDDDTELVRDLRSSCGTELNRLAYLIPESLMQIYDDLERVVGEIIQSNKLSDHEVVAFKSFLLVVSQRASVPNKEERFSQIVDPIVRSWTEEKTMKGLMDLQWFMERVGIVKIAEYFRSRGVTPQTDLLETNMDEQGRQLKAELKTTWSEVFPIRATRIFIQYTIEKLDHSSPEYQDLLRMWKPRVQSILPHILQLVAQIEAYHNPNNWTTLPAEVQAFVKYTCQERFWQVGISTQTRDEFVDENVRAMHTLRDFADSVGHIIRYTREYAFLALGTISQLEETMFEMPGMATNLCRALAGESVGITSHAWRHMISLVIRNVVRHCPSRLIPSFMGEFLPQVLIKLDEVLVEKWSAIGQSGGIKLVSDQEDDTLSEEMMEEHLLRQLTAIVDRLLIDLVGQYGNKNEDRLNPVMRATVLQNKEILAPFLNLCSHIMLFRDTRCCYNCCLILRYVLPDIMLKDREVDEFLVNHMMKTCMDVLSDAYFLDAHGEAAYIITNIYTTLRTQNYAPFEKLSLLLPGVPRETIVEFETRLISLKSLRQRKGVFLEFLALVQAIDNWDKGDQASRQEQKQRIEKKSGTKLLVRRSAGGDIMEDDNFDSSALSNLFGDA